MNLIRQIPKDADLLSSIHGLFGSEFIYYNYKGIKYLKIVMPDGKIKCYKGYGCF